MNRVNQRGEAVRMTRTEKKQLVIFVLVSYGVTYAMGILMWVFYGTGTDFGVFPSSQMFYPAAGVIWF